MGLDPRLLQPLLPTLPEQLCLSLPCCRLLRKRGQLRAMSKDLGTQGMCGLWAQSCFQRPYWELFLLKKGERAELLSLAPHSLSTPLLAMPQPPALPLGREGMVCECTAKAPHGPACSRHGTGPHS